MSTWQDGIYHTIGEIIARTLAGTSNTECVVRLCALLDDETDAARSQIQTRLDADDLEGALAAVEAWRIAYGTAYARLRKETL
jgi:hypothetical protein